MIILKVKSNLRKTKGTWTMKIKESEKKEIKSYFTNDQHPGTIFFNYHGEAYEAICTEEEFLTKFPHLRNGPD